MTLPAKARPAPRVPGALDALSERLDQAGCLMVRDEIAIITVPIATVEPTTALDPRGGFLWSPPRGAAIAGGGATVTLRARGPNRFDEIRGQARDVFARVRHISSRPDAPSPRLFGGFSFCPQSADQSPWTEFGDAMFWLPSWSIARDGHQGWLSIAVENAADPMARSAALDRAESLLRDRGPIEIGRESDLDQPAVCATEEVDRALWTRHVDAIRREIALGNSLKVVAARRSEVDLAAAIDPRQIVARLADRFADCFVFAMCTNGASFVGATPERLVRRIGDRVQTEAVAGSISPRSGAAALLSSAKDRGEQDLVVRAIERALEPLCGQLDIPAEPGIRALADVLHLETRIEGRLRQSTHVLQLVAALHPTPAVGGVPTDHAVRWIENAESSARGWYAAPVGWFDATGNGEFAVAIRSGLLCGRRAYVYAGAGIVRDSDPDREYGETGLKQRALLGALGIRPAEDGTA